MKKLGLAILLLAIAAAAALFWLRGNLDGLVKDAIEKYGSEMTGAPVRVAEVNIDPANGRGVIRGLFIGNPAGFKAAHALTVDSIDIAIDLRSLAGDVVTIEKIAVAAPDVIYEKGAATTNFAAIRKNVADYAGPSKREAGKKLIVGELAVRNAKAHASAAFMDGKTVDIALPDIVLRDLGKSKGGVTPGELGQEIFAAFERKLSAAANFDRLLKSMTDGLEGAGEAVRKLFGQ